MSRRRQLTDEEHALWSGFTRSITPLRQSKSAAKPKAKVGAKPSVKPTAKPPTGSSDKKSANAVEPPRSPRPSARDKPPAPTSPPLAPLGRRLKQRVARGRDPIEARIDLHGLTQTQAHGALLHFLRRAQADGARIALVVTGKGSGDAQRDFAAERGVLRRQVPLWLALPEFRPFVVGFEPAHVGHGGQGALYVRLRRGR